MELNTFDLSVFIFLTFLTIAAVFYGNKKTTPDGPETLIDYLLMGRQLTLPLFLMTLVATWYGGILGVTQIAYEKGIYNFITQGFFWYVTYIIFAFFLVNRIRRYEALTLPDLVGKMFGKKARILAAIFNLFNVIPIAYTISLGILIQSFFSISFFYSMLIGLGVVSTYCMLGGFRAVVFSDVVQFFIMCLSVLLVLIFSYTQYGGLDFLKGALPSTHFELTGGNSLGQTFVWGFIALSTLVDPNFYQRCFAAKNSQVAKKGILLATFVWFLFDICTTLGGMYARAVMPEVNSNQAYIHYSFSVLPNGLKGFFLAGLVATIVSTIDSYIFVASNTLSFDFFPRKRFSKKFHHIGVLFVGIITLLMGTIFDGNIKNVWKTIGSYSASCLLFPVILGHIIPGKISDNEFSLMVLIGVITTTCWKLTTPLPLDELYVGVLSTMLSLIFIKAYKRIFGPRDCLKTVS